MIDTQKDELLSLVQAAAQCPAVDGKKPHASSIWRWMTKGCRGVRLEHVRVGRRVVTTREALEVFFRETAQKYQAPEVVERTASVPVRRTDARRRSALDAASKTLARHGIKTAGNSAA